MSIPAPLLQSSLSIANLLAAYLVEIFPFAQRTRGIAVFQFFGKGAQFLGTNVNPIGTKAIQWRYFVIYCAWIFVEALLIYFLWPETSGRSLEELAFRKRLSLNSCWRVMTACADSLCSLREGCGTAIDRGRREGDGDGASRDFPPNWQGLMARRRRRVAQAWVAGEMGNVRRPTTAVQGPKAPGSQLFSQYRCFSSMLSLRPLITRPLALSSYSSSLSL